MSRRPINIFILNQSNTQATMRIIPSSHHPDTPVIEVRVDPDDIDRLKKFRWYKDREGVRTSIKHPLGRGKRIRFFLGAYLLDFKHKKVSHLDKNTHDFRKQNLKGGQKPYFPPKNAISSNIDQ